MILQFAASSPTETAPRLWRSSSPLLYFILLLSGALHAKADAFRALAIACDLPDGLHLTIDERPIPVRYPTGKVSNLSAFQPGTYTIKAQSLGCLPYNRPHSIDEGKIHTWFFFTLPIDPQELEEMEAEKIEAPEIQNGQAAEDKIRPTHTLNLYDFTTPTKITKPATVLLDLTGTPGGISLFLDRIPVQISSLNPLRSAPRPPGSILELRESTPNEKPFFSQKIGPGNHAIVAIFRKRSGQLAAVIKTL